ncbi:MAG: carbohydrate ABC transporter permease [Anaerolineales bacterium]|nr:carbohydrate ABC transporter permease [Anaerolineales bacterium]
MVAPFVWMVSTAFKQPADQFSRALIPNPATLENFPKLWEALPFSRLIFNSLLIAGLTTIGQLLTCAMAAFVFAVVRFRGRETLFLALLLTLTIPFHVTLVPNFILFKWLGLIGTQVPAVLPGLGRCVWHLSLAAVFSNHPI